MFSKNRKSNFVPCFIFRIQHKAVNFSLNIYHSEREWEKGSTGDRNRRRRTSIYVFYVFYLMRKYFLKTPMIYYIAWENFPFVSVLIFLPVNSTRCENTYSMAFLFFFYVYNNKDINKHKQKKILFLEQNFLPPFPCIFLFLPFPFFIPMYFPTNKGGVKRERKSEWFTWKG